MLRYSALDTVSVDEAGCGTERDLPQCAYGVRFREEQSHAPAAGRAAFGPRRRERRLHVTHTYVRVVIHACEDRPPVGSDGLHPPRVNRVQPVEEDETQEIVVV